MYKIIKKTKKIGKYANKSSTAHQELKDTCKEFNIKLKKIQNPPNTRWSGYHKNLCSVSLYISWFQSNYLNIRIFCIIRIFKYWFLKNEYYSLFVFVQFWFPNIIRYLYSSHFHYSLQHWIIHFLCMVLEQIN